MPAPWDASGAVRSLCLDIAGELSEASIVPQLRPVVFVEPRYVGGVRPQAREGDGGLEVSRLDLRPVGQGLDRVPGRLSG